MTTLLTRRNLLFGSGKIPNCLPVMKDWNYMVRLYRPHAEILMANGPSPRRNR
jgi:hypothetical protein